MSPPHELGPDAQAPRGTWTAAALLETVKTPRSDEDARALLVKAGIIDESGRVIDPSRTWGRHVSRTMSER
ncbi:MAG: hypothetical protein IT385_20020 [Deltaproteobacteria bacterium]|nr:hypothetical protein [Deltaproteobacteria bacterium]